MVRKMWYKILGIIVLVVALFGLLALIDNEPVIVTDPPVVIDDPVLVDDPIDPAAPYSEFVMYPEGTGVGVFTAASIRDRGNEFEISTEARHSCKNDGGYFVGPSTAELTINLPEGLDVERVTESYSNPLFVIENGNKVMITDVFECGAPTNADRTYRLFLRAGTFCVDGNTRFINGETFCDSATFKSTTPDSSYRPIRGFNEVTCVNGVTEISDGYLSACGEENVKLCALTYETWKGEDAQVLLPGEFGRCWNREELPYYACQSGGVLTEVPDELLPIDEDVVLHYAWCNAQ